MLPPSLLVSLLKGRFGPIPSLRASAEHRPQFGNMMNLARMIHERFCCNRGFTAATSLSAGVLATQSVDILFQVCLPPSWLCLPVSPGDSAISRRTVMNNAG